MSRAYRIKVSESLRKVIKAHDKVSTCLEILPVLPQEQMAELLADELRRRGFTEEKGQLVREQDGIVVSVDPAEGTVTVSVSATKQVELAEEREGWAADEHGKYARQTKEALRRQVQSHLEREAEDAQAKLQSKLTDKLEGHLDDLRRELDQVANRVTADALKRKASQLGQIKEISEDPQSGSMTIVLEV
jgi:hypothetical protein